MGVEYVCKLSCPAAVGLYLLVRDALIARGGISPGPGLYNIIIFLLDDVRNK